MGIVEAPRGTLIHDYVTDEKGCIKNANLIVGTTHNIGPMNMSVKQDAASLIKGGIPLVLDIVDSKGAVVDTIKN